MMDEQLELFPDDPAVQKDENVIQDVMVLETGYYNFLMDKASKYLRLMDAGVDNWEGYADAMRQVTNAQENDSV